MCRKRRKARDIPLRPTCSVRSLLLFVYNFLSFRFYGFWKLLLWFGFDICF